MSKFNKMVVEVKDSQQSEALQKHLFKQGYFWRYGENNSPRFTDAKFIYTENDGTMLYGDMGDTQGYEVFELETESVVQVKSLQPKVFVTLEGKYSKQELQKILSEMA